jgi:hypothetical protein
MANSLDAFLSLRLWIELMFPQAQKTNPEPERTITLHPFAAHTPGSAMLRKPLEPSEP